uniref:protein ripply1 n=1 Tax=Jaculus jaculus TaxID=51337 RepID=UPI001E1B0E34|nr:protein ripply1 [Jaculus jaculus]XP_044996862.1 protein ripply1 [Jaculus jaculus]
MDLAAPADAPSAPRDLVLAQASILAQVPGPLPDHLHPSSFLSSGQEVPGNERGAHLWRPWLSSTNDHSRQVVGGATSSEVTKASSEFHHPVRLFWPKSRSFDYLYSAGEILLKNFPVQATINLYEDSDSEEDEDDKEEDEEEEASAKAPEGCVRGPEFTPHKATAHAPSPPRICPN